MAHASLKHVDGRRIRAPDPQGELLERLPRIFVHIERRPILLFCFLLLVYLAFVAFSSIYYVSHNGKNTCFNIHHSHFSTFMFTFLGTE